MPAELRLANPGPVPVEPQNASTPGTPTEATAPLLVDALEAARLLNISPRTLWQLTKDNEIRCRRIGRRTLYSLEALREFANK